MATLNLSRCRQIDASGDGVTVVTEAHSSWSRGWVARIGVDPAAPLDRFSRSFLNPDRTSLSRAGNGSKTYEALGDGLYEADSVYRSYQSHRVFFRVTDGTVEVLTDHDHDSAEDRIHAELNGLTVEQLRAARFEAEQARQAARVAKAEADAAANASAGLPALSGSEKQVRWAESIRAAKLGELRQRIDRARDEGTEVAAIEQAERNYQKVTARSEARWWIDHREYEARSLFREA